MIGQVGRFAGPGILKAAKFLKGNATAGDLAFRLGIDLIPTTAAFIQTPGDLGDKSIAAGSELVIGSLSGLGAARLGGSNRALSNAFDTAGSIAGNYAAFPVADTVMRGKDRLLGGKGQTPYERLSEDQQKLLQEEITQQVLYAYGLLPGRGPSYVSDPTTGQGVA